MREYAKYVWQDSDGISYQAWEDMDLDHHRNVIAHLRRKVVSLQWQWKTASRIDRDGAEAVGEVWRSTLLILEEASIALAKRVEGTEWELEPTPTPVVKRKQASRASTITGEVLRKVRFGGG